MFNANQFYPTPPAIAKKMHNALTEGRKYNEIKPILEPSVGQEV